MTRKPPSRNLTLADLHADLRRKFNNLIESKAKNAKNTSRDGSHRNDGSGDADSV